MMTLIEVMLLVALASHLYHTARRFLSPQPTGNPVLDRLSRDLVNERDPAAKGRESALTREPLVAMVDPTTYRHQMNELAHAK